MPNWSFFNRNHHHRERPAWDTHCCELPAEENWEVGMEVECDICGKLRRFLGQLEGWVEFVFEELASDWCSF